MLSFKLTNLLIGCSFGLVFTSVPFMAEAISVEQRGFGFVHDKLMHASGGIHANLENTYPESNEVGVNHQMLSEYAGIAMEYAVRANRKSFFRKQHQFVNTYLRVKKYNTYRWRTSSRLKVITNASATIDDFRIVHGYLQAANAWDNPRYLKIAKRMGKSLRMKGLRDDVFTNAIWWSNGEAGTDDTAIISYFDFPVMQALQTYDSAWSTIEDNHYTIVENAAQGNGLYKLTYDIPSSTFEETETSSVSTIHELFLANRLAEAGYTELAQQTLDFFKSEYQTEDVYNQYTLLGEPTTEYKDIANYALLGDLAGYLGDTNFQDTMIERVKSFQINDKNSTYDGAFMWSEGDRIYAFVQLVALRAIAE